MEAVKQGVDGILHDGGEHQGVFVFQPDKSHKSETGRPLKKRKLSKIQPSEEDQGCPFAPLLDGKENLDSVNKRFLLFRQLWSEQDKEIQAVLKDADADILEEVSTFVDGASPDAFDGRIPTGLITLGSNVSSLGRLLERLSQHQGEKNGAVVVLESGDAPNLKTTLKNIIRSAISSAVGNDGYQRYLTDRTGPRLLPYDLDLLHEYAQKRGMQKLIIAFRDSEAFDVNLLADLLSLLSSWLDRLPVVLLFGVATSVDLFEGRLSRSTVSLLQGSRFEIQDAGDSIDRIFEQLQARKGKVWLGHNVCRILFERSRDHFQSPENFGRSVKYALMSHFFANPLTVLLSDDAMSQPPQGELCEAIRNLPSFRKHVEDLLDAGKTQNVRRLLGDDELLITEAREHLTVGQDKMNILFRAVETFASILRFFKITKRVDLSDLFVQALSGALFHSSVFQDVLTALKKVNSENLETVLEVFPPEALDANQLGDLQTQLGNLVSKKTGSQPLRSKYDDYHAATKTTVENQRVKLSKGTAKLSKHDIEYTAIIEKLHDDVEAGFAEAFIKPHDLFMHEVFLYDLRVPSKDSFTPRPRFAIERALAQPFDYLVPSSEEGIGGNLSSSQPMTAILYQLYLESGNLVNVCDLWRAFYSIVGGERGEECDERMALAHFYRALSELKVLGMVKQSRKKVDHVAKSAWKSL